ncbi:PLP-dependent aminotransferase family protein [Plantibacter sp. ME-Dv--P-122b]|uniref:aminotransferase-like domain-containing protein n=1 Tax=Plantibacter sp. ME-Dv--P-122b TaxID=3040300 RepID=UPI002550BCCD|nr:PLP-dependent aminotransferase family protein [Plantibacter sp. ME-Dv--P-122b]
MTIERASANAFQLVAVGANRLLRLLGDWQLGEQSLHDELAERLRVLIRTGALVPGSRLPSERALGAALGVSRNTVTKALDELRADGVVSSRQGDGTYVTVSRRRATSHGGDRLRSFGEQRVRDAIDLRSAALPGLPMVADEFNRVDGSRTRELVAGHGYLPAGLAELRLAIAAYYTDLGLPTAPEHILVTSGAQQALRLAAAAFISHGSTVLVEEPTFRGAIESLTALGARLVGVRSGPDGIDVDDLARQVVAHSPVLIVIQSTVHNPSGSVLDGFRRSRVASISTRHNVPVIDDATLADTVIDGERRPIPLAAGGQQILTVGSVSKSFWGGLRVGWLRAHPDLIAELTAVKGGEDLGTSVLAQIVAARLLGKIERARDERLSVLTERRALALAAIAEHLPDWTPHVPVGGGSLWIQLPEPDAPAFVQRAERNGVRLLPGPTFSVEDRLADFVRLSYANDPETTRTGIELLAATWNAMTD